MIVSAVPPYQQGRSCLCVRFPLGSTEFKQRPSDSGVLAFFVFQARRNGLISFTPLTTVGYVTLTWRRCTGSAVPSMNSAPLPGCVAPSSPSPPSSGSNPSSQLEACLALRDPSGGCSRPGRGFGTRSGHIPQAPAAVSTNTGASTRLWGQAQPSRRSLRALRTDYIDLFLPPLTRCPVLCAPTTCRPALRRLAPRALIRSWGIAGDLEPTDEVASVVPWGSGGQATPR